MTNREPLETLPVETEDRSTVLQSIGSGGEVLARIQNLTKTIDGAVKVALTRTLPQDWVKQGEKFYLQATGVQKVRSVFGIYYKDITMSKVNLESGGYAYVCAGVVGSRLLNQLHGDTEIWIEGMRNSNDPFFTGKDGNRSFDEMDVRKSAHANFQVRGATALLGLGNFTEQDLRAMGVNTAAVAKVEYKSGAEGGGSKELISDAQRKRLFAIMKSSAISEESLKKYLKLVHKIDSTSQIQKSVYESICRAVESKAIVDILMEAEKKSERVAQDNAAEEKVIDYGKE